MAGDVYHSREDLQRQGERVREKAIAVTMKQEESYGQAQLQANNDASRYESGQATQSAHYQPNPSGSADDPGNLRRYLADAYQDLPLSFTQFAVPDPAGMRATLTSLYHTADTLRPSLQVNASGATVNTPLQDAGREPGNTIRESGDFIATHTQSWGGDAADAFKSYVQQVQTSAEYQYQLTVSLANGIEAVKAIREKMLTDIWTIGDATYKALDELDGWCGDSASQLATLTVFGALASVAFVATDGVAAVGIEALQSTAAIIGAAQSGGGRNGYITGATVPVVLSSMNKRINELRAEVDRLEQAVAKAMTSVGTALNKLWPQVVVRRPDTVVTAGTRNAATLEKSDGFYPR